jgi:O-antigen/teichoic acid export membrane protein
MSRSDRAAKGYLAALVQYFSRIAVQIVLAPLILAKAGPETLGAYAAISQLLVLLTILDVTGSWALDRFLAQSTGLDDGGKRFNDVFFTATTVLFVTNTIFAILVVLGSFFVAHAFHLTPNVAVQARYALYVIAAWAILKTPFMAYAGASGAKQDIAATNLIGAFLNVGRNVASLVFVAIGGGLFGLMMAGTVVDLCGSFLYRWRFKKLNPDFKAKWGIPDKQLLREMLGFGGYTTLMNLGNRLFLSSANMLAGLTHGAIGASELYSTQMPASTGFNILYRFTESATPAVHEIYGRGEKKKVATAFTRLLRLMLIMTFPLAIGTFLFNQDVVTCWVGLRMYAGGSVTLFLACYIAVSAIQGLAILFSFVVGWIRFLAVTSCLQGLANFALGYYLGKKMGLSGIVLSLLIVMLPQLILLLRRLNRFLELNSFRMILLTILRTLLPLAFAAAAGLLVHAHVLIARHRYSGLAAECLAFTLAYAIGAYFLAMHKEDREDTNRYMARIAALGSGVTARIFGSRS